MTTPTGTTKSIRLTSFAEPEADLDDLERGEVESYTFKRCQYGDTDALRQIFVALSDSCVHSIILLEESASAKAKKPCDRETEQMLVQILKERYLKGQYDLSDIEVVYEFCRDEGEFKYSNLKSFKVHVPGETKSPERPPVDPKAYSKVRNFGLF